MKNGKPLMKILLLIPPTDLKKSYGKLKSFSNPQPSIGLAYIAAALKKAGHTVEMMDAYVNSYSLTEIMDKICESSPDVIGISVLTPTAEVVYEIAGNIRSKFPNIKIVMGNMHASLFSDEILSRNYADFIIHREGEVTMVELLNALEKKMCITDVQGVSFKKGNTIINNRLRPHIEALDNLPFPEWNLLPMDKYSTDPRTEVKKGFTEMQLLATRGCPNQCTFCSSRTERSMGSKYRMRSPKSVVDEMIYMHTKFGSEVFSFMDLAFPLVKRHATDLCNEMITRGVANKFKWVTECRVRPLDEELLSLMKHAGCVRVCFGIESGSNKILKLLKKNFTTEDVRKAVLMAHKAGLEIDGMFMIGLPEETEETIKQTIDFAIELNLRYAIFNIFVPYPGCELWDILKKQEKISFKSWSEFTSYPTYSGGEPVYVPEGLTKKKLMKLQTEAMKRFYLRPGFILHELKNIKLDKIAHYLQGLKSLLLQRNQN
jgi:radical SAM superfamily enzyme YgiQ (UPF0313 family)